jgi:hypothetical protein
MSHLGHAYYVCLLSAAEAHGFAHQRPQVFQVMTSTRLRDRSLDRVRLSFISSSDVPDRPVVTKNTPTGTMRLSTTEGTALDLVSRPPFDLENLSGAVVFPWDAFGLRDMLVEGGDSGAGAAGGLRRLRRSAPFNKSPDAKEGRH